MASLDLTDKERHRRARAARKPIPALTADSTCVLHPGGCMEAEQHEAEHPDGRVLAHKNITGYYHHGLLPTFTEGYDLRAFYEGERQ